MQMGRHIPTFAVYYSSISVYCDVYMWAEGLRAREDGPLARGMERHAGGTNWFWDVVSIVCK